MADYWKSLPRKFCTFCKCWITDNKPSVEFHEKGKKHQENVQIKIAALRKKGQKDYEEKQNYENDMKKIEKAALKAFQKDLESNPELISKITSEEQALPEKVPAFKPKPEKVHAFKPKPKKETFPSSSKPQKRNLPCAKEPKEPSKDEASSSAEPQKGKEPSDVGLENITEPSVTEAEKPLAVKVWYEGVSDEGYTYYWNKETGESRWECPEEGYISVQEQNESKEAEEESKEKLKEAQSIPDDNLNEIIDTKSEEISEDDEQVNEVIGPKPRNDPYGQWVTVAKSESVDLQLPEHEYTEIKVPIATKESRVKFKERTVATLQDKYSSQEEVEFKKRKLMSGKKRNIRRRESDD